MQPEVEMMRYSPVLSYMASWEIPVVTFDNTGGYPRKTGAFNITSDGFIEKR